MGLITIPNLNMKELMTEWRKYLLEQEDYDSGRSGGTSIEYITKELASKGFAAVDSLNLPNNQYTFPINDFGNLTSTNNAFYLKIVTSGGTTGQFGVYLNCSVPVTSTLFCTGVTQNESTGCCPCGTGDTPVRIYAQKQPSLNFLFLFLFSLNSSNGITHPNE